MRRECSANNIEKLTANSYALNTGIKTGRLFAHCKFAVGKTLINKDTSLTITKT